MTKIPITKPYIDEKEKEAVAEVLASGWLVQGEKVSRFEELFSKYVRTQYARACNSCTAALHMALVACGLPVVLTEGCAIGESINGKVGLVVANDRDKLSEALLKLLENEYLRQLFGKDGRKLVQEKYNWANIAKQMEKVYQLTVDG